MIFRVLTFSGVSFSLSLFVTGIYFGWITITFGTVLVSFFFFVFAIIFSTIYFRRTIKKIRLYRQGIEGERFVGSLLERLRSKHAEIIHDLTFEKFNIDHLIISEKGVLLIETKNYSKTKGQKVIVQNDHLLINNQKNTKILQQVRSYGMHLQDLLKELTGRTFPVTKVVLFVDWFVEGNQLNSDVWVMNEKAFIKTFEKLHNTISKDDSLLISCQLRKWSYHHSAL